MAIGNHMSPSFGRSAGQIDGDASPDIHIRYDNGAPRYRDRALIVAGKPTNVADLTDMYLHRGCILFQWLRV